MSQFTIVGLGSAGYAALTSIKRRSPKASITVIDRKPSDLVHPCGLPYSLEGLVHPTALQQDIGLGKMGVRKIRGSLSRINTGERMLTFTDDADGTSEIEYGTLILCLGSRPAVLPIDGLKELMGTHVFTLCSLDDCIALQKKVTRGGHAIVIGAGAIGLETAMAVAGKLESITVLEMKDQALPGVLDADMAKIAEASIINKGINFLTGVRVTSIARQGERITVSSDDKSWSADFCVISSGFLPNCSVAMDSGIECNDNGIMVNEFLQTSSNGIYAAGDCISGWSIINGSKLRAKLATSSYKHGIIAAINATGGAKKYRGSAGTFVTKIGDLEIAGTGFTTEAARQQGFEPVQGKISAAILPEYFPGNSEISVKIISDSKTGKILGAQALGNRGAAERINIISTAIEFGISLDDLGRVEMAYCPAVSEVHDPLLIAADFAMRRIKR